MNTRRDALRAFAFVSATPALRAQHEHPETALPASKPLKPFVFSAEQMELITLLVEHIIPRSDSPGAADAGVPWIVDLAAANNPTVRKRWLAALAFFDKAKFRSLTQEKQVAFLIRVQDSEHFRLVKDSTIDAYYSTREGLVTELGWHGNTFLSDFPGCTHPEHQIPPKG